MFNTASISVKYSIDLIQEEARNLIQQRKLDRQQPIYTLCQFIPAREWPSVENELERHGYLLRDHLIDLLGSETWQED
ncbi:conserved hypothetical protein [Gloeothece citriformis PCC 7424]|uniref:DUF4327 domain-containing protein n=1 Tax=Gloeothece citriformis (strain PCC 7424) TaxID=65393 RepID=B7K790_GLOC7|nr:DUF4327 family protein [Gloeothece citriformis]ACK69658.1 conserved hypothetical protein [Gloeothece citriformis PCC 7424]